MADLTVEQWSSALLKRLGIKQTPGAMQALVGWARAEGGHYNNSAHFNPLNTTQPEPGAGNTGSQGNIKVYKSWDQGLQATVETLRNGRYQPILQALKSGNPGRVASAIGQTPWGTSGGLVTRTIMGTKVDGAVTADVPSVARAPSHPAGPMAASTTPVPTGPPITPGGQNRQQLLQQYLTQRGRPGNTLSLAAGLGSLQTPMAAPVAAPLAGTVAEQHIGAGSSTGGGALKITGPNPGRIKPSVMQFGRKVSDIYGRPLVGSDGSGHSRLTVNGNVSQHTTGNATDIPASGKELIRMGQAALEAAGMPRAQARKQTGGLFNVGGHQVIFNTHLGGDHTDHLHISAR